MMHKLGAWIVSITLVMLASAAGAQTFTGTTEVLEIQVPVHVVRDGQPVRDLTLDDFELFDGKRKQKLIGLDVVDLGKAHPMGDPRLAMPLSARRHFLILFDLAYAQPKSILQAREAALELVQTALHPSDLVAVATFSLNRGPRLVLTFTSDRRQVEAAIATLGVSKREQIRADPLGVMMVSLDQQILSQRTSTRPSNDLGPEQTPGAGAGGGQVPGAVGGLDVGIDLDIEAELQEQLQSLTTKRLQVDRQFEASRVTGMARSMTDLGALLDSVKGRKHVVYLSEGFDSSLFLGETNTAEANRAIESGQLWDVSTDQMFGDSQLRNDIEGMLESFRRSDAVIHSVNIAGVGAGGSVVSQSATNLTTVGTADLGAIGGSGRNTLLAFARGTGGSFYDNDNDLGRAMDKILTATSVTYLLSFEPKNLVEDGSFRKLRVRVKDAPRGTKIEHRPGYFAPKPAYAKTAMERRLQTAELIFSDADAGLLPIDILAVPLTVENELAYVPVSIEVDGLRLIGASATSTVLQAEIFVYATDAEGRFLDFFTQILELDLYKVRSKLEQRGLAFSGHLDLPPGEHTLRVLVRNSYSGSYGLKVQPLVVPASAPTFVLHPPIVGLDADRWLVVFESRERATRTLPSPFEDARGPFLPAVRPTLEGNGSVPILFLGQGLGEASARATILDEAGRTVGTAELVLAEADDVPPFGTRRTGQLSLGGLGTGNYRLRVTANHPDAAEPAVQELPFVVGTLGDQALQ